MNARSDGAQPRSRGVTSAMTGDYPSRRASHSSAPAIAPCRVMLRIARMSPNGRPGGLTATPAGMIPGQLTGAGVRPTWRRTHAHPKYRTDPVRGPVHVGRGLYELDRIDRARRGGPLDRADLRRG